tara:strand:- start:18 stop:275 length:258 start_codon:yes stop_codon:yes gene_type:complete
LNLDNQPFRCYQPSLLIKEIFIKIEVKDNNVEQALRVLKRKLQREGFFKVIKMKSNYEKPSEKKKRIKTENIKRVKKLLKLKNRI